MTAFPKIYVIGSQFYKILCTLITVAQLFCMLTVSNENVIQNDSHNLSKMKVLNLSKYCLLSEFLTEIQTLDFHWIQNPN